MRKNLSKELRLRLFTLRVLLAIHASKARMLLQSLLQRLSKGLSKTLLKALLKTLWQVFRATRYLLARFLLPVLVQVACTSTRSFRKLCLRHPRPLFGGAILALSLLSLLLIEPQHALKDVKGSVEGSIFTPELRLSLLPQVLPAGKNLQKQQGSFSLDKTKSKAKNKDKDKTPTLPSRIEYRVLEHAVQNSLHETAFQHGIPLPLLRRFVDVMSYDVDFQRDIWAGARFRMLVSQKFRLAEGGAWQPLAEGVLEMAELYTGRQGSEKSVYRYYRSGWDDSFYDEQGKPAKRLLRRTPMSGLRLTSRFGMRRHPILGYTRMHKGVDFAAPRGTPILAAGDGVVRKRAYGKGYGRYVLLQHNDRLSTMYAHMRGFARGLRVGGRVRQGQVIGYVGTSGMSTGAHLHYEIHRDGRAVNPRRVKLPKPKLLTESKLSVFIEKIRENETQLARGGIFGERSALADLRALGCGIWSRMCDDERHAQR